MTDKKKPGFDPAELDRLLKELDLPRQAPAAPGDSEYFNPWNMGKKKASGTKRIYCSSLPDELPE